MHEVFKNTFPFFVPVLLSLVVSCIAVAAEISFSLFLTLLPLPIAHPFFFLPEVYNVTIKLSNLQTMC